MSKSNPISYSELEQVSEELFAEERRISRNKSHAVLMVEWGEKNIRRLDDTALQRVTAWEKPRGFMGLVAAEIARRQRRRQNQIFWIAIATLVAAVAVPIGIESLRPESTVSPTSQVTVGPDKGHGQLPTAVDESK